MNQVPFRYHIWLSRYFILQFNNFRKIVNKQLVLDLHLGSFVFLVFFDVIFRLPKDFWTYRFSEKRNMLMNKLNCLLDYFVNNRGIKLKKNRHILWPKGHRLSVFNLKNQLYFALKKLVKVDG